MYERLTCKNWLNLDPWECCGQDNYCKRDSLEKGGCCNGCIVPKLYRRLGSLEDAMEDETSDVADMHFNVLGDKLAEIIDKLDTLLQD